MDRLLLSDLIKKAVFLPSLNSPLPQTVCNVLIHENGKSWVGHLTSLDIDLLVVKVSLSMARGFPH